VPAAKYIGAAMTESPAGPRREAGEELPKMSFGDHLDELRRRLWISIVAVVVAVLVILPFKDTVTGIYVRPYQEVWYSTFADYCDAFAARAQSGTLDPAEQEAWAWIQTNRARIERREMPERLLGLADTKGGFKMPYTLVAIGGLDDIWTYMAAALLFALIAAAPIVLYQLWAFVSAGLYQRERRVVLRYFPAAAALLVAGAAFGYLVVVPYGLYFLIKMMNVLQVSPMLAVSQYFSLLLTLTAALGAVFQLPLLMLAVQRVGLVSYDGMRKNWRYVILGIFVFAAVVTPPDPFTQTMMAGPMVLLYLVGLLLCRAAAKRAPALAVLR
jgi:Tat protein translocase TatC